MADQEARAWPRPNFKAHDQRTSIVFVCFGKAPLADLPLSRERFGVPGAEIANQVQVVEHRRSADRAWFENWWSEAFGVIAEHDLGEDLALLTSSDTCYTLQLDLPDQPDLAPVQTIWALSRWLCARGCGVVLDVHAFRYRTHAELERLEFEAADIQRDIKLTLETDATQGELHLMHTRGLCKFGRPELYCYIQPDDASTMGRALNQIARAFMEGALPGQIRLRVAEGVELVTSNAVDSALVASLGLQAAVLLTRADGGSLTGIGRLTPSDP